MSLTSLLMRRDTSRKTTHVSMCMPHCAALNEEAHIRHHLLEDLAKACAKANAHQRTLESRFAIFEQCCGDAAFRESVVRCSHEESRAVMISSSDVELVKEILHDLINACRGVHLSHIRDISTDHPRTTYITYEVRVEVGATLPSN